MVESADELERRWSTFPPEPRDGGTVRLVCLRAGNDVHHCPPSITVTPEDGAVGDRWAQGSRAVERQLTIMSARAAALVADDHAALHLAGDNILVDLDLSTDALPAGTRLAIGTAIVVVSAVPHTGCKKFVARFGSGALAWTQAHPARRLRGINAWVEQGGVISLGDPVAVRR